MKKALKRRLVFSAMASFLILIVLLVGSITVILYREQERMSTSMADTLLSEDARPAQPPPPNWFGYQFTRPAFQTGFYLIETDLSGAVTFMEKRGDSESEEDIAALAVQIVQQGKTEGKTSSYKFHAVYEEQSVRIVLVDQTVQVAALYQFVKAGGAVGALCLLVLFIILQPIAGYVADAWVRRTEQQKQFITNAGHELKTPVSIILSNTEALELMEGETKYSRNIHQQSLRLDKLIRQLLMIARVDESRFRDQMEKVDLSALTAECLHAFDTSLEERGMKLRECIAPQCCLRGHRESLRQMLEMLLENAVQYGAPNGCIQADLSRVHGQLRLAVTNSVVSLPDCEPNQLFERFFRADKARTQRNTAGCGVGLSAAQTIVQLHRGTIAITYPEEQLFRVTVTLPASRNSPYVQDAATKPLN